jgi:hypothetical protein
MLGIGSLAVRRLLLLCLLVLIACESRPTATGRPNAWIKGQSLYARIGSTGTLIQAPKVELKNDSPVNVTIAPLTITVVYKTSGRRQMTFPAGDTVPARLGPGQELKLDYLISVSELTSNESPKRVQVDVGPPKEGERFVVEF